MAGFIERNRWKSFLDDFTKRNQFRATRLEVVGDEVGAQPEEEFLPLVGVSLESKGTEAGSVVVILGGETARDQRHVERLIEDVRRIAPLIGETSGLEEGVGFEDGEGAKTLLVLEQLPEIPAHTSSGARTSTRA
jgi:Family of unknown function (DUF5335)